MITLQTEARQRLYYHRYRYAIDLTYVGFEYMDQSDPEFVAAQYHRRQVYSWQPANNLRPQLEQLLTVAVQLHDFETAQPDIKVTNCWSSRFYYTNSDTAIGYLRQVPEINVVRYREADVCLPDGVLLRKNNAYQFRTYFRERKLDPARGSEFLAAVNRYGAYFNLNHACRLQLAKGRRHYPFSRHSYIEHNSMADRVLLEMLLPGYLGPTLPIQAK